MKFQSFLALLALTPLAVADTTKILSKCYTALGKSSKSKIGTTSYALSFTFKVVQTKTSTLSTTVTPKATTLTTTQVSLQTTTTTLPQVTDTFTSTILEATTQISTVILPTVTSNIEVVVTSSVTPTSTVPAPNGFVPLRSQFPVAKRAIPEERPGRIDLRAPEKNKCTFQGGKPVFSPALYPTGVKCGAIVNVFKTNTITKTAAKVSTITAPTPITTVTVTSVSMITSTVAPVDADTTVFTTAVITSVIQTAVTPTSIVSSTTTVTEIQPSATSYAACGVENQVMSINGARIGSITAYSPMTFIVTAVTNPYDCCVSCQTTGGCYGYVSGSYTGGNYCYLLGLSGVAQGQCGSPTRGPIFDLNAAPATSNVIGNGPCGQYTYQSAI